MIIISDFKKWVKIASIGLIMIGLILLTFILIAYKQGTPVKKQTHTLLSLAKLSKDTTEKLSVATAQSRILGIKNP